MIKRKVLPILLGTFSIATAQADTKFDEISVGSVVQNRILINSSNLGVPIPPGEWINTGKTTELDQFGVQGASVKKPKHSLTFINKNRADSPLFALIVTFFPEVPDISWSKPKCESTGGSIAVGLDPQSDPTLYLCAQVWSESKFRETISNAEKSDNPHVRLKLAGLKGYLEKVPDDVLSANILGSKDHGTMLNYTFFLERVANPNEDASYTAYIKMGARDFGLTIWDALKGKDAAFSVAKAYEPASSAAEQAPPPTGATIPYLENVALKVGQTAVIHGARGNQCGQPAPSWEKLASTLPTPATGKLSDGGEGVRFSQRCGGETPARAIRFSATTPGSEQIKLFGDPIRIEVR